MVSRQLTPLLAIDLDGTYVTGNTLHLFAKCALQDALRRLNLLAATKILTSLTLRKLHLITHIRMKNALLRTAKVTPTLKTHFQQGVQKMLSQEAQTLLKHYREEGYHILLATAASEIYVPWIWEGDYIATAPYSATECRGEEKRRRVEAYASQNGLIPRVAITDHPDDLPLLSIPTLTARHLLGPLAHQSHLWPLPYVSKPDQDK